MTDEDRGRARLIELAKERGVSLSSLSTALGRNVAYLQQWAKRRSPRFLEPDDRLWLARHFQVDERELGARDPWTPPSS